MEFPHDPQKLYKLLEDNPELELELLQGESERERDHALRVTDTLSHESFHVGAGGERVDDTASAARFSKMHCELLAYDINTQNAGRFIATAELS